MLNKKVLPKIKPNQQHIQNINNDFNISHHKKINNHDIMNIDIHKVSDIFNKYATVRIYLIILKSYKF
jgi:hypothetical protein